MELQLEADLNQLKEGVVCGLAHCMNNGKTVAGLITGVGAWQGLIGPLGRGPCDGGNKHGPLLVGLETGQSRAFGPGPGG